MKVSRSACCAASLRPAWTASDSAWESDAGHVQPGIGGQQRVEHAADLEILQLLAHALDLRREAEPLAIIGGLRIVAGDLRSSAD